jgi:8-oxo-dGTP pyrophosphatase MutT (NUDIX family)
MRYKTFKAACGDFIRVNAMVRNMTNMAGEDVAQRLTRGRRDVVTAFIQRPRDLHVLLVRRSQEVGTYPHMWGGVSGGVEGNERLLHRAQQEILEETGYGPQHVDFVRSGRPLYIDDNPSLRWAVHPYLFQLNTELPPTLNWENVDARFVSPDELCTMETVPQLAQTLSRVALSAQQQNDIAKLIGDRSHGAAELSLWALSALEGRFRESIVIQASLAAQVLP